LLVFISGIVVEIVLLLISAFILKDLKIFMNASAFFGLGCIGLSAFSTWLSSDNVFKKIVIENTNERKARISLASKLFLLGLPGLIGFFIALYTL
jgi:hypothetical protein